MSWMGIINLRSYLLSKGIGYPKWKNIGWKEIHGFLKEYAPTFNACSADLTAFRARGGKLIMTTGWEDQTIAPGPIVDYYENVCEKDGGIEKTIAYFRLFCVPGCAHGGGKGRLLTGSPGGPNTRRLLADWCEKGTAPDRLAARWHSRGIDFPVAAYPGLFVKEGGKWKRVETPRGVAKIDACCRVTSRAGDE